MSRRHELSDQEWDLIKDLLPRNEGVGRRWEDHRRILNGMFWIVRTGAPWRDIPERYGPWQTIFDRFNRWRKNGTLDRMLERLQIRLDKDGKLDWDLWCIDGSSIRASRAAAGAGKRGVPKSPPTTLWAARAADSGQNSTWYVTAEEIPSPLTSPQAKSTSRRPSKKS